ncbi:hypothetical protein R1479_01730 [Ralstonia mannitolilytica]|nr:hypothetical protein R1479_01730 [Ralstonia mannitolilytica]
MPLNLTNLARGLALALAVAVLAGCATSKEKLLTHGDRTMMDIWQQEAGDGGGAAGRNAGRQLLDARQSLRRPLTDADVQAAPVEQMRYTRTARNEVHRQFQRLHLVRSPGGLALPGRAPSDLTVWRFAMSFVVNDSCLESLSAIAAQHEDWIIQQAIALLEKRVFKAGAKLLDPTAVRD